MGIKNIALIFGVRKETVYMWLVDEKIPRFSMAESARIRIDRSLKVNGLGVEIDPDKQYNKYLGECFSHADLRELAEQGRITRLW